MLIIERQPQKALFLILPDGRQIKIVNYGDRRTRIAIDAPKDVQVWREELLPEPVHQK